MVVMDAGTGEVLALAGENGSGKSTLIRIIAGVERANNGQLFIEGADWTGSSPIERIEGGIQVIYQDFALFPNLSAGENIWLPHQLHQRRRLVGRSTGLAMAHRVLKEIGVTVELDRPVADLPVSQKQLVAIARALVHDARLLIMDEPTTALTHREVEHLFEGGDCLLRSTGPGYAPTGLPVTQCSDADGDAARGHSALDGPQG